MQPQVLPRHCGVVLAGQAQSALDSQQLAVRSLTQAPARHSSVVHMSRSSQSEPASQSWQAPVEESHPFGHTLSSLMQPLGAQMSVVQRLLSSQLLGHSSEHAPVVSSQSSLGPQASGCEHDPAVHTSSVHKSSSSQPPSLAQPQRPSAKHTSSSAHNDANTHPPFMQSSSVQDRLSLQSDGSLQPLHVAVSVLQPLGHDVTVLHMLLLH
jgi:hypothetical protein